MVGFYQTVHFKWTTVILQQWIFVTIGPDLNISKITETRKYIIWVQSFKILNTCQTIFDLGSKFKNTK